MNVLCVASVVCLNLGFFWENFGKCHTVRVLMLAIYLNAFNLESENRMHVHLIRVQLSLQDNQNYFYA